MCERGRAAKTHRRQKNPGGAQQAVQRRHTVSAGGLAPCHLREGLSGPARPGPPWAALGPAGQFSREASTGAQFQDLLRAFLPCFLFNLCTDRFIFVREEKELKAS